MSVQLFTFLRDITRKCLDSELLIGVWQVGIFTFVDLVSKVGFGLYFLFSYGPLLPHLFRSSLYICALEMNAGKRSEMILMSTKYVRRHLLASAKHAVLRLATFAGHAVSHSGSI